MSGSCLSGASLLGSHALRGPSFNGSVGSTEVRMNNGSLTAPEKLIAGRDTIINRVFENPEGWQTL